jgi:Glycosyltransferase
MSFIFVGRLDELKGVRTLLEAWRLMGADAPLLRVCGNGPMEDWCLRQSEGLNVEWMGFVDSGSVKRLIAESKALIMPTLWYEGFGMTVIEAFSCGVPVICSDLGNAGSLVEEGVTGWKFEAGNAEELVRAVRKSMHSDTDFRDRVRSVYKEKYSPDANYRRLEEIYLEVQNANRSYRSERGKLR